MFVRVCGATGELTAVLTFDRTQHPAHPGACHELVPEVMGSATALSGDLRFLQTTDLAPSLSRGTQANGLTTTDGGEDQIGLHPVGEIQVTQLL